MKNCGEAPGTALARFGNSQFAMLNEDFAMRLAH
jgi:hypothetical protein